MKNKEHLPMMGVGPIYVAVIILLTIVGIILSVVGKFDSGKIEILQIPCLILGILLILYGIIMWIMANFHSKVDEGIKSNHLITTGIYAYTRNPIYTAFLFVCTGALFIANNLWLLILPVVYWMFLTVLMRCTEEKWLRNLYGKEYEDYCKRVNRCIPWFERKGRGSHEI